MFCKNCGKEIPNDTKFCNFCGAEQNGTTQTQAAPQNTPAMPKKNTNLIIIAVVVIVAFILGVFVIAPSLSSDKENSSIPTSSGISTDNNSVSTPSIDKENSSTTLENLVPENSDDHVGDVYSASLGEGGIFTVSFGYYLDSPKVIDDFTGSVEVEKTNPSYNEIKKECEKFGKRANQLNDSDKARIKCRETDTGIDVTFIFDNLADADRIDRVNLASEFIGIKDTEGAFYFDSVVSQLTEIGFERGILNK